MVTVENSLLSPSDTRLPVVKRLPQYCTLSFSTLAYLVGSTRMPPDRPRLFDIVSVSPVSHSTLGLGTSGCKLPRRSRVSVAYQAWAGWVMVASFLACATS